jgi:Kef-type K+ transport system membrane component KefB
LAVVVAIVKADGLGGSLLTICSSLLFIGAMLFVLKPRAERLVGERLRGWVGGNAAVAWALAFIFTSALFTEVIGIHALFGAFLAGVVMPPHAELRQALRERLGSFTSVFLMPLFFAFTGLRTQIGLLDDWQSWLMCSGVIAVAVVGKLGGSMLAARWTGMGWQESFSIGALMNTRGLIELMSNCGNGGGRPSRQRRAPPPESQKAAGRKGGRPWILLSKPSSVTQTRPR